MYNKDTNRYDVIIDILSNIVKPQIVNGTIKDKVNKESNHKSPK